MLIEKPRVPVKDILLYGLLPGPIKKLVYRLKGYRIGKSVCIGFGSVVCGDHVTLGEHSKIGYFSIVRGKEISIGAFVSIGSMTFIDTPYVEIGEGSKINEQVYIGGLQFPDSKILIGRNCQIMQMSFINPARSIVIGDDTGIGGYCLVFGHTSWLSQFEGYPVEFKPIEIGTSVSLAWNVFVLPGVKIGDGAVVSANSLVHKDVPSRCLAAGFPARVISKYPDFPREISQTEKEDFLKNIVSEMIAYFRKSGLTCEGDVDRFLVKTTKKWAVFGGHRTYSCRIEYAEWKAQERPTTQAGIDVLLSLRGIPPEARKSLSGQRTMWIDIERKEQSVVSNNLGDEVVLFLRRYGVRFFRVRG